MATIKKSKVCRVCIALTEDLQKEIFATSYYIPGAPRKLLDVYQDHHDDFSYDSLKNHVKRHQFMAKSETTKRTLQTIKNKKREQTKLMKAENRDVKDVWDRVIDQGMQDIEEGKVMIKPADLLKAAKDKSDYEIKVNDQKLAYAEMMWHFASGESNESKSYDRRLIEGQATDYYDPTQNLTDDSGGGENKPNNLHNSITWDAITQGATKVPEGNNSKED